MDSLGFVSYFLLVLFVVEDTCETLLSYKFLNLRIGVEHLLSISF